MTTRLTRSEREHIIASYLKGTPVNGYEVIECANGKYRVKVKQFEVEEDAEEPPLPEASGHIKCPQEPSQEPPQDEPLPVEEIKPKEKANSRTRNAKELLKELSVILGEDELDTPEDNYYNKPRTWNRRKLRF